MVKMKKILLFYPVDIKTVLEVPDNTIWWLYWTPAGDELIRGYLTEHGYVEEDVDWTVWMQIEDMNRELFRSREYNFGSSDEVATHVLVFNGESVYVYTVKELMEMQRKHMQGRRNA